MTYYHLHQNYVIHSSDRYSLAVARVSERGQDSRPKLKIREIARKNNRQALKLSTLDSFLV